MVGTEYEQIGDGDPRVGIGLETGNAYPISKAAAVDHRLEFRVGRAQQYQQVIGTDTRPGIEQQVMALLRSEATHMNDIRPGRQLRCCDDGCLTHCLEVKGIGNGLYRSVHIDAVLQVFRYTA